VAEALREDRNLGEVVHILATVPCSLHSREVERQVVDHIQAVELHIQEEELDSLAEVRHTMVDILAEVGSLEEEHHTRVVEAHAHNHNQAEDNRLRAAAAEVRTPRRMRDFDPAFGEGSPTELLELNEEEEIGSEESAHCLALAPLHGADACEKPRAYLQAAVARSAAVEAHQKEILCQGRACWQPHDPATLLNVPAIYHLWERSPS